MGDRLESVNGISTAGETHESLIETICKELEVELRVVRTLRPSGPLTTRLQRTPSGAHLDAVHTGSDGAHRMRLLKHQQSIGRDTSSSGDAAVHFPRTRSGPVSPASPAIREQNEVAFWSPASSGNHSKGALAGASEAGENTLAIRLQRPEGTGSLGFRIVGPADSEESADYRDPHSADDDDGAPEGVFVDSVEAEPAASSPLCSGQQILTIGGRDVRRMSKLQVARTMWECGSEVELTVTQGTAPGYAYYQAKADAAREHERERERARASPSKRHSTVRVGSTSRSESNLGGATSAATPRQHKGRLRQWRDRRRKRRDERARSKRVSGSAIAGPGTTSPAPAGARVGQLGATSTSTGSGRKHSDVAQTSFF